MQKKKISQPIGLKPNRRESNPKFSNTKTNQLLQQTSAMKTIERKSFNTNLKLIFLNIFNSNLVLGNPLTYF